ncbi:sulfurtransferase [Flavobacterium sp. RHBU_24]|uniref:sulfurtransferase n=1 Tax=Flavobacterium sp. RHBU_24 TaxID=3391185 RepID=UPI00398547BD
MENNSPLITLSELLSSKENPILIDAGSGQPTFTRYQQKHIKGALYVDLNNDLAAVPDDAAHGGRHPLPSINDFAKLLGNLGITPESHVIVYDDKQGSNAAARFWWMLRAVGHAKVQVLNGGLQAAEAARIELSPGIEISKPIIAYPVTNWQLPMADINEVRNATKNGTSCIIDVRDTDRYLGLTEPLDPVAGHIPSAINIPFKDNMDGDGLFLSPEKLREKYKSVFEDHTTENSIVHCGSGVTACHTLLAIAAAGLPLPKLYVGSWSEWCRNQ